MFVGEIGIPRREYLYELSFWESRLIYKGYRNRYRDLWTGLRWHAFRIMGAIPYVDLAKAGINRPSDLIQFPWDVEPVTEEDIPTEDEVEDMKAYINQQNQAKTE